MKVKLKDVAQAAGVSVSTVSRVLNNNRDKPASPETVEKIWSIVKELGYVPNQSARSLVQGENDERSSYGQIGCIYTSTFDLNNDPFFSCIGLGIQKELNEQNYTMAYALSAARMDYKELYSYVVKHPADGIIILGRFEEALLEMLKGHFQHMVYAGVNVVDAGIDEVICNGYDGARAAILHLVKQGHKEIGYVGYVPEQAQGQVLLNEHRFTSYCDLMMELHGEVKMGHVVHTNLRTTIAYDRMLDYLEGKSSTTMPTAFYCANDATAFGVMKALQENGYKMPEDVAIVGLDNVEMASFVTPRLTTVQIPQRELGSRAVKMLIEQIEGKRDYPLRVTLPFELIIRESSDYKIKNS